MVYVLMFERRHVEFLANFMSNILNETFNNRVFTLSLIIHCVVLFREDGGERERGGVL